MGKGEGRPGRRRSVYESWEVNRSEELREVQCSWSADNGTKMRDKAGEVGWHQKTKGLKSHGKAWALSQEEVVEGILGGIRSVMLKF